MSIANTNRDNLQEYSMIELALIVLEKTNKALNYRDIFDQVADLKGYSASERQTYLALFYTDLNLDGRFLTLGAGEWGLKSWYSVEQIDEIIQTETQPVKRKKKKKATKKEDDEPSIDDHDEDDLTEVPLDIVEAAYKNSVDDDGEDTITLSDDLIDEDDFDDEYDDDDEDDDLDDEEDDDDEYES